MADIKISELGAASAVNATDLFPMTSSGVTVKATAQQIKNYMGVGNLTDLDTTDKSSAVAAINEVNTKVSKTEDLIAYVQTTLTASKAYAVGEQFVYNGLLYKATATIAQGGTITINGNCELADSVTEQITNLPHFVDYNNRVVPSSTTYTATEPLFVTFFMTGSSSDVEQLKINDVSVSAIDNTTIAGTTYSFTSFSGYVKIGDVLTHRYLRNNNLCKIFKLSK